MLPAIRNELPQQVSLAHFSLRGITVRPQLAALEAAVQSRIEELRREYPEPAAASEVLQPARALYRSMGIDPSRRRPSSEALLRRILQGKGLYAVNTAVDAANLASLSYFLPVGLYDLDRVAEPEGPLVLRLGDAGEEYEGIGKGMIHVEGRPTMVDREGPFGNPSSDSYRTRVTTETSRLLFVVYAPANEPSERMREHESASIRILREFVGGEVEE
jgi:DNA/RNA-binding domain of Phe-tRNA-synthetase-like protein